MRFDPFNCTEKELAKFCFDFISIANKDETNDRKSMNYILDYMASKQVKSQIPLSFPLLVLWKISGSCNANCHHCWAALNDKKSDSRQIDIAEQLVKNEVLAVSLSGGEPFLNNRIFDLISILKRRNTIVEILSNGSLITEEIARKLSELLNPDTDLIQVSLDGSSKQLHDKQRNAPIFDAALEGIKNLKKFNLKVRNVFVATPINQHDLYNTYKLANDLGVDAFSPCPVFPLRKGNEFTSKIDSLQYLRQVAACKTIENNSFTKLRVQVDQVYQSLIHKYYDNMYALHDIKSETHLILPEETNIRMQIDAFGEVLPGPEWEKSFSAGNIYEKEIKEIWKNGHNWEEFRRGRDLSKTKCASCKIYTTCCGGNSKLAYEKYGTINMPDGTCLVEECV